VLKELAALQLHPLVAQSVDIPIAHPPPAPALRRTPGAPRRRTRDPGGHGQPRGRRGRPLRSGCSTPRGCSWGGEEPPLPVVHPSGAAPRCQVSPPDSTVLNCTALYCTVSSWPRMSLQLCLMWHVSCAGGRHRQYMYRP